jgi:hypothetical protein
MKQIFIKSARKEHKCSCCGRPIKVGEPYTLLKERMADYEYDRETGYFSGQKGILYLTNKFGHGCQ